MTSSLATISEAMVSAIHALSREVFLVSANKVDHKLNVERTSFLRVNKHKKPGINKCILVPREIVTSIATYVYFRLRCLVFLSNFSHSLSRERAYSYSTSPRRLKNSWNSASRESLDSILRSMHPNCSPS